MLFFVHLGIQVHSPLREVLTAELISREIKGVKELLTAGTVCHAWKRGDCQCVILLFDAADEEECRAALAALPFAKAGILDIQLIAQVEPFLEVYADVSPG